MNDDTSVQELPKSARPGRGIAGLVLFLVWPVVEFATGMAMVLAGLPPLVGTLAGLVLPPAIALVWLVPPPGPARRGIGAAALAAVHFLLGARGP